MTEENVDNSEQNIISVLVPEHLNSSQKLYEQPPFDWLRLNDQIFPVGFFKNEEDFPYFLRAVVLRDEWVPNKKGEYGVIINTALSTVTDEYAESVLYTADKVRKYLAQYPYAKEYLKEKWRHVGVFQADGTKNPNSNFPNGTYARYAHDRLERDEAGTFADMAEGMPHLYKGTDVVQVVAETNKGQANKYYRVVKQSEAL